MSQQILDMIARMGGADSVAAMASRVGLSPEQGQAAMAALVPALAGGMAKQVQAGNGSVVDSVAGLAAAAGTGEVFLKLAGEFLRGCHAQLRLGIHGLHAKF